ncbi:MAG: helix-turn-helix transcriptional regulator [Candidatus Eremiobacteraeota bacterium]|nr:helix-turn-helix transcriptional regulator [Candidatus Eremiobacteraeota bacterium]
MSLDFHPGIAPSEDIVSKRRAFSRVLLLSEQFNIEYAHPGALELLAQLLRMPAEYLDRFPLPIELQLRDAVRRVEASGRDVVIEPAPALLIRVSRLKGTRGKGITALLVEERTVRDSIGRAREQYRLTNRESEVLRLLLRGKPREEIARKMCIEESTVSDYIKTLLRKTYSKNRAEMIARICDEI